MVKIAESKGSNAGSGKFDMPLRGSSCLDDLSDTLVLLSS